MKLKKLLAVAAIAAAAALGGCSSSDQADLPESFQGEKFERRDVINDSTGKWRLSTTSKGIDAKDYAFDYWRTYMDGEDSGVEGIVNFATNTTTSITDLGGVIDVTVHEYVEDEEHDANALYGGPVLKEYHIDPETGEVTEIQ